MPRVVEQSDQHGFLDEVEAGRAASKKSSARKIGSFLYQSARFGWASIVVLIVVFLGFQLGGFIRFVDAVTATGAQLPERVDGIVVFTGGENRIQAAVGLLQEQRSKRMLITGVNPEISDQSLRDTAAIKDEIFECCIEVDRRARDTIDNAEETTKWVRQNELQTVVIVTGAFHMPRAMLELSHALDQVDLIAFPVNVPTKAGWWREGSRLRDLVREYGKLSVVRMRDHYNWLTGQAWPYMPMLRDRP